MSDVDWICESCTFINSGLITNCEICGALREAAGPGPSKWSVAGPDDPIILSDGEEGTDAEVDNKDVINLVDDDQGASACRSQRAGPGQGPIAATRNRSRTCLRDQRNPDIMVIKDDDDGDEGDVGSLARPSGTQPTGGYRDTLAFTGETSCQDASGEVYALDNCSCAVKLQHLAEQLRPAVTAAAMILSSAKPAIASAALVPKAATPCATLFDLAKSLLCPSGCGRWLSSRDVRLLLGPLKTAVLYYALCAALRREGKGSKAVAATAADSGGDALLRGECAAGHLPKGSAASGTAERCAAPNDAVARLLALSPSCPGCRRRMLPVCVLDQSRAQLEQTPPSQRQQPMPAGPSSARLSYHTALEQAIGHVASEHPTAMAVHLREALVARGQPPPPATASVEQLGSLLRNTLGPRCSFLCLGCSRNLETEVLSKTQLQELQSTSDKAFRALKLLGRVRAVLLNTQEDGVEDDEEGDEEGAEADAGGCAGRQSTVLTRAAGSGKESTKGRRRDGNKRRCKRRRLDDPSNAWAKGVGYGGSDGSCGSDNVAAVKAAQERQREADDEVRSCLKALLAVISPSGYPGGGGGGGDGGRALASPPPLLHAVLQYGGLPYVLRLLFQNDSLLDMGQREGMYREAMALVKCFTSSMSLLELLVVPASDPRDTPGSGTVTPLSSATASDGHGAGGSGAGSDPPLSTIFESIGRRCAIFKRSAQELVDGAEEDIAALGLALELGALADEVSAGVSMWQRSMGKAHGALHAFLVDGIEDGDAVQGCSGNAGGSGDGTNIQLAKHGCRGERTAGGAGPSSAVGDALSTHAAHRSEYVSVMRPLQFREVSLLDDHYYSLQRSNPTLPLVTLALTKGNLEGPELEALMGGDGHWRREGVVGANPDNKMRSCYSYGKRVPILVPRPATRRAESSGSSAGGDVMRRRLKRITGEISGLATGLPLDWEASAFVAVDNNRVDVLRALLIPASDTPYANGAFIFDIYLPPEYPNVPPKVKFLTTGGGKVRFNPNLYRDGKVCLSLLGTWAGPSWDPAMSTILQVLVSIQSMILVSDPYYNEPGMEVFEAQDSSRRQDVVDYANRQRYNTLAFSILPALEMAAQPESKSFSLSGGSTFRDVLAQHFRLKRAEVLRQCDEWMVEITASATSSRGSQETILKYTEMVLPKIKSLLQSLCGEHCSTDGQS